ncbi:phosphopantetheine-binding protein [Kitasatospora aburaviensis]
MKVRGIRVDPAEVEAEIAGHPGVAAVAVSGATVAGRSALVAYVVPRPGTAAGTLDADLRAHLGGRVPGHLMPSRITVVPALVLTASGKVDRAGSHRRYAANGSGSGQTPAPPRSLPRRASPPDGHRAVGKAAGRTRPGRSGRPVARPALLGACPSRPATRCPTGAPVGQRSALMSSVDTTSADVEGVAEIFRRVLESSDVEPDSDFFLLGGDSLIATRVLSAVARTYGVELTFDDFALAPTPAGLVRLIATAG